MNRIKLSIPDRFSFSTSMQIRVTDLNYGNHVGNDTILSILQEARQQFLASRGYRELDMEGYGLIMADAVVEYKREIKYPGNILVSVNAQDFDKMGFDIFYKIELISSEGPVLAVKAKSGMMLYDYGTQKKASMTEVIVQKLS
ncbi:MAG: thioesterase family protein [Sphingobacteriia bacterium]|nr:thioesterase family protein [Sphingobacteriia bacterium]